MGCIAFSPLAQGMLTDRYLEWHPPDSRAAGGRFLKAARLRRRWSPGCVRWRNRESRGQTLAQMALAWVLRDPRMTSAPIGASRPEQVQDAVGALAKLSFTKEELRRDRAARGRRPR